MENKCFYCRADVNEHNKVPAIVGAQTEYICVACDDRVQSYTNDERYSESA